MKRFSLLFVFLILTSVGLAKKAESPPVDVFAPHDELLRRTRSILKGQGDMYHQVLRRLGNKTITLELYISGDADNEMIKKVLSQPENYGNWALHKFNERSDGSSYRLKVLELTPTPDNKDKLTAKFSVELPILTTALIRNFSITLPDEGALQTVKAVADESEKSSIENATILMKVFPAEGQKDRVWIYVGGKVQLRSWLMYEALPEKLLKKETGERALIVLDNYQREESRIKSSQSPKERKAAAAGQPKTRPE